MQDSLFDEPEPLPQRPPPHRAGAASTAVGPAPIDDGLLGLAGRLPRQVHLGTSSWNFPGWAGLVWDAACDASALSRRGLPAYARHPLLRTVSIDRSFYRPLTASQFADYAAQVPEDFRFVVKAPSLVADAMVRGEDGRGMTPNPAFLDPTLAAEQFVQPALDGLGMRLGALVFQLSPLPPALLDRLPALIQRIGDLLAGLPLLRPQAPDGIVAVEVRNPELLTPAFAEALRAAGATYCLGLHARMPPIAEQLPLLRALWPGPLVCRWSLNRRHGAYGYEEARSRYEPFDRLVDPDLATRSELARVAAAFARAGQAVLITINNKAEGSAPLSVRRLAEEIDAQVHPAG